MRRALTLLALLATTALVSLVPRPVAADALPAEDVLAIVDAAATRHGITPRFLRCLSFRESSWRPWVTSAAGDAGLMQFQWRTWRWMSAAAGWPAGTSPYSAEAAADVAAWAIARGYVGHWPPARFCGAWR